MSFSFPADPGMNYDDASPDYTIWARIVWVHLASEVSSYLETPLRLDVYSRLFTGRALQPR